MKMLALVVAFTGQDILNCLPKDYLEVFESYLEMQVYCASHICEIAHVIHEVRSPPEATQTESGSGGLGNG